MFRLDQSTGELIEVSAGRCASYWGKMRSYLNLMHRSKKIDDFTIDLVRSELSDILDSGILIYPQTLKALGVNENQAYADARLELGIPPFNGLYSEDQHKFLNYMKELADKARKGNWAWRIGEEADYLDKMGWYPFFVTLTVDPLKTDPETLWREGREFRKYIRRLADEAAKCVGDKPPRKTNTPESEYVRYAGVIEHGSSREHHHAHIMVWIRDIPPDWKLCPNRFVRNPARRVMNECKQMRTKWPWSLPGLSKALYFRTHNDVWHRKHGFVTPMKLGKPMRLATARIAGLYITKYLKKEHKEWQHRMKATRNLGLLKMRNHLKMLNLEALEALSYRPKSSEINTLLTTIHSVPIGLLRSEAKRMHFCKKYNQGQLDIQNLLTSNSGLFIKMLRSVQDGVRPDRMHSTDFFDWVSLHLPEIRGYCENTIIEEHTKIAKNWPKLTKQTITKIGGNDFGPTYSV